MTIKEIFTYDNLYKAYKKAIKNVAWKESVQRFIQNDIVELHKLQKEILKGTYKSGHYHFFTIIERGKERHIASVPLRERIVQKCFCDNYLTPLLEKYMIYENGATRKGKGMLFQIKLINNHIHKFYLSNNRSNQGYILKLDIHHFFESIDHEILIKKLSKIIKEEDTLNFLVNIINDNGKDKGLELGNQTSQGLALFYLSGLDHYIKEHLYIKYYGRYMDDFYLIHKDRSYLEHCFNVIKKKLKELKLILSKNKSGIKRLSHTFTFLKIKYHLKNNGALIRKITNKTFSRKKVKLDYIKRFTQYKRWFFFMQSGILKYNYRKGAFYGI